MNNISLVFLLCIVFFIGLFVGRSTIKEYREDIIQMPPIVIEGPKLDSVVIIKTFRDTVFISRDIIVNSYIDSFSINRYKILVDSINSMPSIVDKDKLYMDYISVRDYKDIIMFDNSYGKYVTSFTIQYNKLDKFYNSSFQQNVKVVTNTYSKSFTPFVSVGYKFSNMLDFDLGLISNRNNIGISVGYSADLEFAEMINRSSIKFSVIKTF